MSKWRRTLLLVPIVLILSACAEDAGSMNGEESSVANVDTTQAQSEIISESNQLVEVDGMEVGPLLSRYMEQMGQDQYFMEYIITIEGGDSEIPSIQTSFAKDGETIAISNSPIDGGEGNVSMIMKDGTLYTVNHEEKTVYVMAFSLEDEETAEAVEEPLDFTGIQYVTSGVEDGLNFEEYQAEGVTFRYYFSGDEFVKMTWETPEMSAVMEVIEFSNNPPQELFEIPEDYEVVSFDEMMDFEE